MQAGEPSRNMYSHSDFTPSHTFSHLFRHQASSKKDQTSSNIIIPHQTFKTSAVWAIWRQGQHVQRGPTPSWFHLADVISGFLSRLNSLHVAWHLEIRITLNLSPFSPGCLGFTLQRPLVGLCVAFLAARPFRVFCGFPSSIRYPKLTHLVGISTYFDLNDGVDSLRCHTTGPYWTFLLTFSGWSVEGSKFLPTQRLWEILRVTISIISNNQLYTVIQDIL
jgi:hypothetical protein